MQLEAQLQSVVVIMQWGSIEPRYKWGKFYWMCCAVFHARAFWEFGRIILVVLSSENIWNMKYYENIHM